jgi:hypothetical protein
MQLDNVKPESFSIHINNIEEYKDIKFYFNKMHYPHSIWIYRIHDHIYYIGENGIFYEIIDNNLAPAFIPGKYGDRFQFWISK